MGFNPVPIIELAFVANQTILGNILTRSIGTITATVLKIGDICASGNGISLPAIGGIVTWTAMGIDIIG
jgi:hypothetical protein